MEHPTSIEWMRDGSEEEENWIKEENRTEDRLEEEEYSIR